jgi:hypothetical protein
MRAPQLGHFSLGAVIGAAISVVTASSDKVSGSRSTRLSKVEVESTAATRSIQPSSCPVVKKL